MYAIIETGGKQFKVTEGCVIFVEKVDAAEGAEYVFDNVLAVLGDGKTEFGAPYVANAKVGATVVSHGKGKKVIVYKYKSKKGYHKKNGHRQPFTKLKINSVSL